MHSRAPRFELWVDQSFQWHYQRLDEVKRKLRAIAEEQSGTRRTPCEEMIASRQSASVE